MLCTVLRTREQGWLLPRYRHAFCRPTEGQLQVIEEFVQDLNRNCRVASLLVPGTGRRVPEVPALYDVVMLRWSGDLLILTGIERVPDARTGLRTFDYAQTWQVTLAPASSGTPG